MIGSGRGDLPGLLRTMTGTNFAALSQHVREAAERFEREPGRRVDDALGPGPVREFDIGLFLILNGYAPNEASGEQE